MRNIVCLTFITAVLLLTACSKDKKSERFRLLTTTAWINESVLVDGEEPAGDWDFLNEFTGEAKFNEDGTGNFGSYTGQWRFNETETEITITTESIPLPIVTRIIELTSERLEISTVTLNPQNPSETAEITMIFKSR